MDTRQIEYILQIAEENNITHAAAKLFITQSALNQQLIKLENELGTPLFHRSRTNWHLTEAGMIYVENAKEMMRIKRETYQKIHDLSDGKHGSLTLGFTAGRGINMFTKAYAVFHQRFPNISVRPTEGIVRTLQKRISNGELDVAFLTLMDKDQTEDVYENIFEEELFLIIPRHHPLGSLPVPPGCKYATIDIRELRYEPFVLMDKSSTMRSLIDRIFSEAGIIPQILFETGNNLTIISMIRANLCCGILHYYYVKDLNPEEMASFHLSTRPTWHFTASYKKSGYLSRPARIFIEVMKEQWGNYEIID